MTIYADKCERSFHHTKAFAARRSKIHTIVRSLHNTQWQDTQTLFQDYDSPGCNDLNCLPLDLNDHFDRKCWSRMINSSAQPAAVCAGLVIWMRCRNSKELSCIEWVTGVPLMVFSAHVDVAHVFCAYLNTIIHNTRYVAGLWIIASRVIVNLQRFRRRFYFVTVEILEKCMSHRDELWRRTMMTKVIWITCFQDQWRSKSPLRRHTIISRQIAILNFLSQCSHRVICISQF